LLARNRSSAVSTKIHPPELIVVKVAILRSAYPLPLPPQRANRAVITIAVSFET
jgi:hypothetical protein